MNDLKFRNSFFCLLLKLYQMLGRYQSQNLFALITAKDFIKYSLGPFSNFKRTFAHEIIEYQNNFIKLFLVNFWQECDILQDMCDHLLNRYGPSCMWGSKQRNNFVLVTVRTHSHENLFDLFRDERVGVEWFFDELVKNQIQLTIESFLYLESEIIQRDNSVFAQRRSEIFNQPHDFRHDNFQSRIGQKLRMVRDNPFNFIQGLKAHLPIIWLDLCQNVSHLLLWFSKRLILLTVWVVGWLVVSRTVCFLSEGFQKRFFSLGALRWRLWVMEAELWVAVFDVFWLPEFGISIGSFLYKRTCSDGIVRIQSSVLVPL